MKNFFKRMAAIERRLEAVEKFITSIGSDKGEEAPPPAAFCSFCGKSQHEVHKLVAGPNSVFICNECTLVCVDVCMSTAAAPTKEAV